MRNRRIFGIVIFVGLSMHVNADEQHQKNSFFNKLYSIVKEFTRVDSNYIEAQKYNYAAMLQNTNTYEMYRISNSKHQTVDLDPDPSYKVGPYFGWRWIFLGYTLDVTHLSSKNKRKGIDLSLYSNQLGIDLFYRTTGTDYHIRRINLNDDQKIDVSPLKGVNFSGLHAEIRGFNLYYITNHKKFSYPAAFSQSTCQIKSAGSPILGIGYTHQKLSMDWNAFCDVVTDHIGPVAGLNKAELDSAGLSVSRVKYDNYSVMGGYGYNWVFARHWLFDASLSASLAYLHTISEAEKQQNFFRLNKFTIDGIVRLGIVYNNSKWFAGASSIFHTYNYHEKEFSTNSVFGSVNFYVGFNFGKKK